MLDVTKSVENVREAFQTEKRQKFGLGPKWMFLEASLSCEQIRLVSAKAYTTILPTSQFKNL